MRRQKLLRRPGLKAELLLHHPIPGISLKCPLARDLAMHQVLVAVDAGLPLGLLLMDGGGVRPFALNGVELVAALAGGRVPLPEPRSRVKGNAP